MGLTYQAFRRVLRGVSLPAAVVDLDALARNVETIRAQLETSSKTLRVASKSVRHVGLLRRILALGGPRFRGLMCFTLAEAAFLVDQGFDDLVVAYPSVDDAGLNAVAERIARGASIHLMADHAAHLAAYARVGRTHQVIVPTLLDVDVAFQPLPRAHLGVLRSPLRSAAAVGALARTGEPLDGVRVTGVMGYEAHVAGLPDASPFGRALNPVRRALKRLSIPEIARRRAEAVAAIRAAGADVEIVNGGGTGSLRSTLADPAVTEVTVGSGFLCSHLFDYYRDLSLEPAAFFALEVSRIPQPGTITCLGGGYVASGEPGRDRLPLCHAPAGLTYLAMEGAGEVQTPLRVPKSVGPLQIGDPVIFRHAKAGELAERFAHYHLVANGEVVAVEPTYRGEGHTFL